MKNILNLLKFSSFKFTLRYHLLYIVLCNMLMCLIALLSLVCVNLVRDNVLAHNLELFLALGLFLLLLDCCSPKLRSPQTLLHTAVKLVCHVSAEVDGGDQDFDS